MDSYCVPYSALIIAFFEVIAVSWVYGIDRFMKNVREMLGFYPFPHYYWKAMFAVIAPLIVLVGRLASELTL